MTSQAMKQNTKKIIDKKEFFDKYRSLIALALLVVVVSILSPSFLTTKNIFNVLRQTSVNAIIAAGMTFVILTGGIDLSVGSILAISGAVCASMLVSGTNIVIAVLVVVEVEVELLEFVNHIHPPEVEVEIDCQVIEGGTTEGGTTEGAT